MKSCLFLSILFFFTFSFTQAQVVFELEPAQSMLMSGKGTGQDAVNNPYLDKDSIAIIDNIGNNEFFIRIQSKGEILEIIPIAPNTTKKVSLLKGYELYLDTDYKTQARVTIEKQDSEVRY